MAWYNNNNNNNGYKRRYNSGYNKKNQSKVYSRFGVGWTVMSGNAPAQVLQIRQRMVSGAKVLSYQIQYLTGKKFKKWVTPYEIRQARY